MPSFPLHYHRLLIAALACVLTNAITPVLANEKPAKARAERIAFFETRIRPVLLDHCSECHGTEISESDLRVDSIGSLKTGGISGPAVIPGQPHHSLLLDALTGKSDKIGSMPPDGPLDDRIIADIQRWIADGAVWPDEPAPSDSPSESTPAEDHWAFQPLQTQAATATIDDFVNSALNDRAITAAPRADKVTLIRRATYDLTGLPPTPKAIREFVADTSDDAFAELVDQLLRSKDYGRRYGRHWLDLVRYADTAGDNSDFPIPEMSLYRNYVIDAFHSDMPVNDFLAEQLAGDLIFDETADADLYRRGRIATSFIASARRFGDDLNPTDIPHVIGDAIATIGQSMLGITLECARCHDHKFDPISTKDYYGLYGYLKSSRWPTPGREGRPYPINFVSLSPDAQDIAAVEAVNARAREFRKKHKRVGADLPKYIAAADQLANVQRKLAERQSQDLSVTHLEQQQVELREQLELLRDDKTQAYLDLTAEMNRIREDIGVAYGMVDAETTGNAKVQLRGIYNRLGDTAARGFLSAIDDKKPMIPAGSSGRKILADWITSDDNPLTARVFVNRLWQWHFGRGLVNTPNNFGIQGEHPSHPKLLDFLTQRFLESGWSMKDMHRRIMNSAAYQRAWVADEFAPETDSDNRYYWRFNRRRLEAESIRDTILSVSGLLDLRTPSEPLLPPIRERFYTQHRPYQSQVRHDYRSVYMVTTRIRKNRFLSLFDGADPIAPTAVRRASTVPLQALYWLNNEEIHRAAEALAQRLQQASSDPIERLKHAWELAYGRTPTASEQEMVMRLLTDVRRQSASPNRSTKDADQAAWTALAHAVLMSNELIYVN